jgi:O-acetyl-ADP-ribose deacetylase (regulator of RNase III)
MMDGGVDAAISSFFGDDLARDVRRRILAEYRGEQRSGHR